MPKRGQMCSAARVKNVKRGNSNMALRKPIERMYCVTCDRALKIQREVNKHGGHTIIKLASHEAQVTFWSQFKVTDGRPNRFAETVKARRELLIAIKEVMPYLESYARTHKAVANIRMGALRVAIAKMEAYENENINRCVI